MTNQLRKFLGIRGNPDDPRHPTDDTAHPGYPDLVTLHLSSANLNSCDMYILTKAIISRKLPKLGYLFIGEGCPPDRNCADDALGLACLRFNIEVS